MDSAGLDPLAYRDLDAAARAYLHVHDTPPLERLVDEAYAEEEGAGGRARGYSQGLFAAASCSDNPQAYDMRLQPPERIADWNRALERKRNNDPELYAPFSVDEYLGIPIDYAYLQLCTTWPVASKQHPAGHPVPPNTRFPNVPVLVLNGDLDTITTPEEGAHAARPLCACHACNRRQHGTRYRARRLLWLCGQHRSPLRADRKGRRAVRRPRAGAPPRAGVLSHARRSRSGQSVARKSCADTKSYAQPRQRCLPRPMFSRGRTSLGSARVRVCAVDRTPQILRMLRTARCSPASVGRRISRFQVQPISTREARTHTLI